jgi:hypothetical protein
VQRLFLLCLRKAKQETQVIQRRAQQLTKHNKHSVVVVAVVAVVARADHPKQPFQMVGKVQIAAGAPRVLVGDEQM